MHVTRKEIIAVCIVVAVLALIARTFFFEAFLVRGDSMAATVLPGDIILVSKTAYWNSEPKRGDVVVAVPNNVKERIIKRVVGMPGERIDIEKGKLVVKERRNDEGLVLDEPYLNLPDTPDVGKTHIRLDPKEYFLLGDNRYISIDSREIGPIGSEEIKGKAVFKFNLKTLNFKRLSE